MSYSGISAGGQHEGLHVAQVLLIFGSEQDVAQGLYRRVHYFLHAFAFGAENDILHQFPLAAGGLPLAIEFLQFDASGDRCSYCAPVRIRLPWRQICG